MKAITIFLLFYTSFALSMGKPPIRENENERDYIYRSQLVDNSYATVLYEGDWDQIPTSDQITEHLDNTLSPPNDIICEQRETKISQEDEIVEEEEEEEVVDIQTQIENDFTRLGGSPNAIKQALCFYNKHNETVFKRKTGGTTAIKNKDYIVVQDFTLHSAQKRFFLINLKTGLIELMHSPHGMGTFKGPNNNPRVAEHFSNDYGTNLTPRGFHISGNKKHPSSKGWKWHMKLDGVQKDINDNSRKRTVVFHPGVSSQSWDIRNTWPGKANNIEDDPWIYSTSQSGRKVKGLEQGMTWGCTAVAKEYADEVYQKTKGGALFYNFTPHEEKLGPEYCGHNLLRK